MTAAICPKCRADLVQYRPGVQISEPAPPGRGWRLLLAIFVGIFIVAASIGVYLPLMSDRPAPPAWRQVGHAGDVRFLVVPPAEAASDAVLWRIADRLRGPAAMIHLMFWTSAAGAPTRGLPCRAAGPDGGRDHRERRGRRPRAAPGPWLPAAAYRARAAGEPAASGPMTRGDGCGGSAGRISARVRMRGVFRPAGAAASRRPALRESAAGAAASAHRSAGRRDRTCPGLSRPGLPASASPAFR